MNLRLEDFRNIVFFTGAGMSKESGVPTYRGAGGIWGEYDYERYACQRAFDTNPEDVWEFHNFRRELYGKCPPNTAHRLVAELEDAHAVAVVTQNIDGLHQRAGSTDVIELHGSIWRLLCPRCDRTEEDRSAPLADPHCPDCGAWWRPAIVWFGDAVDRAVFQRANEALSAADLFVAIGTSAVVYPAAGLPRVAKAGGAAMVEVNPEETELSPLYDLHLRGPATEMLPRLITGS